MKKKLNFKNSISVLAIASFTFFALASGENENNNQSTESTENETQTTSSDEVTVGKVLKTKYFEIVVNKVEVKDRVSTGNEFADLKPEAGNKYLIISTTFKNIDKESRMISEGTVWIKYNGKKYEFDKSEVVLLEGWGAMLEQLNPLTSKTTKLVYKLPAEITGTAYWQPGRSGKKELINLGEIK